jgi:hypothetical protein
MACKIIYKGKALPEEEAKIEINNDVVDDLNEQAVGKSIINSALLTDEEINQQITDLNKFKTVIENNYFKLEDNISVSSLVINKHIKNAPASLGKVKIDSKWRTKEEAKKQVEENLKQRKLFSKLKRNFGITEEQLNLIENVPADKAISSAEDLINAIESKLLSLNSLVLNSKKSKSATLQQKEQAKTIEQLFNENPELANVGTQEQYSQYLNTIFPDSKVKDIVYHGYKLIKDSYGRDDLKIEKFDKAKAPKGFYFTTDKNYANTFTEKYTNVKETGVIQAIVNLKNPKQQKDLFKTDPKIATAENKDSFIGNDMGFAEEKQDVIVVFEPEQIHILGSNQDIEGFRDFVQRKQFQKLTAEEKARTMEQITKEHRSITALKDLAHKLAHRIGGKVEFVNRSDVDWKGYRKGTTFVLNKAYMTSDTPFHEFSHIFIEAIKQNKPELYNNLLKELETSETGRKVFEQVKRDYVNKEFKDFDDIVDISKDFKIVPDAGDTDKGKYYLTNDDGENFGNYNLEEIVNKFPEYFKPTAYTLEEQQEEAIVQIIGLYSAEKLDKLKDKTLIQLIKELLKEMSDFVKLIFKKEINITKDLDNISELTDTELNKLLRNGEITKEC